MKTLVYIAMLTLLTATSALSAGDNKVFVHIPVSAIHSEGPNSSAMRNGGITEWNDKNLGVGIYYGEKSFSWGGTLLADSFGYASAYFGTDTRLTVVDTSWFQVDAGIFTGVAIRKIEGILPMVLPSLHFGINGATVNVSYVPNVKVSSMDGLDIPELMFLSLTIPLNNN